MYDVRHNYWLADDARVYDSQRQIITTTADDHYVAWLEHFNVPTPWPRDLAGDQTNKSLQDVLHPHDLFVDLIYYIGFVRKKTIQGDIIVNGLRFSTDPLTLGSLNSAYIYTVSNNGAVFSWKLPDGSFITLNKADVDALQTIANTFAQDCFKCEDTTLDGIEAGTITTREQVDAAFAAVPNSFTGLTEDAQKVRHKRTA